MIIFFSATGNTKFVARRLAEALDDEALDLAPRIRANDFTQIRSEKPLVICSPIHVSEMPKFYADYLKKVAFVGNEAAYGVFTNAGYSGIAGAQLGRLVRKKGMEFRGHAEFTLPGIHITSITNRQIDVPEIERRIKASSELVPSIAQTIRQGERFNNHRTLLLEQAVTIPLAPVLRYIGMGTKGFWTTDQCIACGKCERICPVSAISMDSGKPVWNPSHCAHCMACVHNCPTEAIEYKQITQGKKRYTLAKYRYVLADA